MQYIPVQAMDGILPRQAFAACAFFGFLLEFVNRNTYIGDWTRGKVTRTRTYSFVVLLNGSSTAHILSFSYTQQLVGFG